MSATRVDVNSAGFRWHRCGASYSHRIPDQFLPRHGQHCERSGRGGVMAMAMYEIFDYIERHTAGWAHRSSQH